MGTLQDDLLEPGVELRETHISWVFLRENEVFKVKKPVALGFLDFSTLEDRRRACEAEVELNRRLASAVYLGVVPVTRDRAGRHAIGGTGEVVDVAVHMKRLPDRHRADLRLAEGRLTASHLDTLAERIASFHQAIPPSSRAEKFGSVAAIRFNVEENFQQTDLGAFVSRQAATELEQWQRGFLEDNVALFEERVRSGRVRDGHGDLRLEHVYIDDDGAILVLDCIEFNERFRFGDVCADIVFLSMDLAWRGRVDLAEHVLARYAQHANDYDLYPLVDFYESYRALVRGKIAAFAVQNSAANVALQHAAEEQARRYFLLAQASERRSVLPPRVVAVGGWIASGKSTIAEKIAAEMSAPVVNADRTRKHMAGVMAKQRVDDDAFQGMYALEFTEKVYAEVFRRAAAVIRSGRPVVIDASFRSRWMREAAQRLAREHDVPFLFIECRVDLEICRQRLRQREREQSESDGRLSILEDFIARWEDVEELAADEQVAIDTSLPVESNLQRLHTILPTWPAGLTD